MINRENYEEFFLSYVDNELPAETRLAVERFVAAHPDLKDELELLLQCRIQPESDESDFVFPGKSSLLQYEESFLLYVDGELDESGKKKVEELTREHPRLERELQRLSITVSQPDPAIVFPDKENLYRSDKRRRVVMLPWFQVGAAAAVLAAIILLALPHSHKTDGASNAIAGAATPPAKAAVKNKPTTPVTPSGTFPLYPVKKDEATRMERNIATTEPVKNTTTSPKTVTLSPKTPTLPAPAVEETKPAVDTGNGSRELAVTAPVNTTTTIPEKTAASVTTAATVNIPKEQSSFATQALLKDAQENGTNDVADNLPQPQGKTKLRGLFRRVTRAFGKTADRDDDGQRQVSISVFQVALK
jgi:hypothetical protein